jgi:hypothetical protein
VIYHTGLATVGNPIFVDIAIIFFLIVLILGNFFRYLRSCDSHVDIREKVIMNHCSVGRKAIA